MKQGRTLAEVMQQVEKEAKAKRDFIVPAQSIFMGDEADWIGIYNKTVPSVLRRIRCSIIRWQVR